jgi:hypothetical protein
MLYSERCRALVGVSSRWSVIAKTRNDRRMMMTGKKTAANFEVLARRRGVKAYSQQDSIEGRAWTFVRS